MTMGNNHQTLHALFLVLLIVNTWVQSAPILDDILPKIEQENYKLKLEGNRYHLSLILPDASRRDEVVKLKNPGTPKEELFIIGNIVPKFTNTVTSISIIYTADRNGYRANYRYKSIVGGSNYVDGDVGDAAEDVAVSSNVVLRGGADKNGDDAGISGDHGLRNVAGVGEDAAISEDADIRVDVELRNVAVVGEVNDGSDSGDSDHFDSGCTNHNNDVNRSDVVDGSGRVIMRILVVVAVVLMMMIILAL